MKGPPYMSGLGNLMSVAFDTRVMLAAILGWRVLAQFLANNNRDGADEESDSEEAPETKVVKLQKRLTKLKSDNETLATEVVLLRSELSDVTSPLPAFTPPPLSLPPRRASPSPFNTRLPLEKLKDGTYRLRSAQPTPRSPGSTYRSLVESESSPSEQQQHPSTSTSIPNSARSGVSTTRRVLTLDGLPSVAPSSGRGLQVTSFAAAQELRPSAIEAANKRLAAENEAVRSQLEAIAPGSARNSARHVQGDLIFNPSEENDRLQRENRELREQLDLLIAENEDLSERIMEVAFNSFMAVEENNAKEDGSPGAPVSPNWTLGQQLAEINHHHLLDSLLVDNSDLGLIQEEESTHILPTAHKEESGLECTTPVRASTGAVGSNAKRLSSDSNAGVSPQPCWAINTPSISSETHNLSRGHSCLLDTPTEEVGSPMGGQGVQEQGQGSMLSTTELDAKPRTVCFE